MPELEAWVSCRLGPDDLSATRHYVLVVRLVVRPDGRSVKGEVVDPESKTAYPFIGLNQLGAVVEAWLLEAERHATNGDGTA